MRDDNFRPALHPLPRSPLLDVNDQSVRSATNIGVVHRGGSNAWEFGAAERGRITEFRRGHDLANGAPAQSASTKGECFVKATIEFFPFVRLTELIDHTYREIALL